MNGIKHLEHSTTVKTRDPDNFKSVLGAICNGEDESTAARECSSVIDEHRLLPYDADDTGFTLLHHAVQRGRGLMVTLLLDRGADPNAVAFSGESPLMLLSEEGESVPDLLKRIDAQGERWQKHLAAKAEQQRVLVESVEAMIHAGNPGDAIDQLKAHPELAHAWVYTGPLLLLAARGGRNTVPVLNHMLEQGVNPNAVDDDGNTALHRVMERPVATRHETADVVRTLISFGGDINWRDREGFTPLHAAATHNEWHDRVKLLVELGADINAKSEDGDTPLDILYSMPTLGGRSLVAWMRKKGARSGSERSGLTRSWWPFGRAKTAAQSIEYPNIAEQAPLEYEWEGYESVTTFYTPDSLGKIERYYADRFGLRSEDQEEGKLEYQLDGGVSVICAAATSEAAIDDLHAYVASRSILRLAEKGKGTVGVIFRKATNKR